MSELSETWFEEAKKLEIGQSIMIQVMDKPERTAFVNELKEERARFAQIEPTLALQLVINGVRKDGRFWVVVERKARAPLKGIMRNPDGSYQEIEIDPQRRRMLNLMLKDGLSREEIEDCLGGLTEDEEKEYFKGDMDQKQL